MMNRVMIVTGGARGIGAATVRLAASRGYAVAFSFISTKDAARELAAGIEANGGHCLPIQCDVADEVGMERLFAQVDRELGRPTTLVNNAGMTGKASSLKEASPETIRRVVEVNLTSVILASRLAVQRMSTRQGGQGGCIVNVSSGAATLGSPGEFTWYAASKAGLDALTLGLGKEVATEGIRVVGVAPGLIDTTLHAESGIADRMQQLVPTIPVDRPAMPEEIAEAILWLASDVASYITGTTLRVAGGR